MALVAGQAQLRAKLQTKGKLRPYNVVRKKLPDGSGMLEELPERAPGASPNDEAADAAYCKSIQRVSNVFGKQRRSQTTADEHKMYGIPRPGSSRLECVRPRHSDDLLRLV